MPKFSCMSYVIYYISNTTQAPFVIFQTTNTPPQNVDTPSQERFFYFTANCFLVQNRSQATSIFCHALKSILCSLSVSVRVKYVYAL